MMDPKYEISSTFWPPPNTGAASSPIDFDNVEPALRRSTVYTWCGRKVMRLIFFYPYFIIFTNQGYPL